MDYPVGTRLYVRKKVDNVEGEYKAELLARRGEQYYVHYIDFNKRLDEWVSSSKFSTTQPVDLPKKKTVKPSSSNAKIPNDAVVKLKNFDSVRIGKYLVNTWYFSPYPDVLEHTLYLCERCLYYFDAEESLMNHAAVCRTTLPPGKQIYEHNGLVFYEMDGSIQRNYCRNLSLLAKLFLDHKTLYYDVEPFYFYVLFSRINARLELVGYFSKEKDKECNNNVACILTLPQHQRKGYGRLLIEFSYELSKIEKRIATPEKPLSDLGLLSYRSFWVEKIMELLTDNDALTIDEMSKKTSILPDDIVHTLQAYEMLRSDKGRMVICLRNMIVNQYNKNAKRQLKVESSCIDWSGPPS